jgi:hypothetical protein
MDYNKDTIISFDVETTGFIPGVHSVIALGAVAWRGGKEISSFYGCMKEWYGSERSDSTMHWWRGQKDEWMAIRKLQVEPVVTMMRFYDWVNELPKAHTLAANPACFDAALLWWYLHKFCGEDAITNLFKQHRALDIRTYIAAVFDVPYSEAERSILPAHWSEKQYITHNALDDARQQGLVLHHLIKTNSGDE